MFNYFFEKYFKCKHKKITPFSFGKFCPECGKEIKISWYILRCSCCESKRHACVIFDSLVPRDKYCIKCGESDYSLEKKESIEYFELEYAVISKKELHSDVNVKEKLQIWIENEQNYNEIIRNIRLIPLLIN